jgi:hypothetical protein
MYHNNQNRDNWRMNKYGRKQMLVAIKKKGDKFPKGYMRWGGKVYSVVVSSGAKEDRNGNPIEYWVSIEETTFR